MILGIELVEKLYSEGYTIKYKRFGIVGRITSRVASSIKNAGKIITNPRKYLYEDPINSALQNRFDRFNKGVPKYDLVINSKVSSELENLARKNNISVIRGIPNSDYITDSESLLRELTNLRKHGKISPLQLKRLKTEILTGTNPKSGKIIALTNNNPSENPEILAHELGHFFNSKSKGISGLISRGSKSSGGLNFRNYYGNRKGTELRDKDGLPPIKEQLKRSIGSRLVEREEKNATNRAIRLLRQSGMDNNQLGVATRNLRSSYNTYKNDGIIYRKYMNYRRFFQPKSDWRENSFVNPPINTNYL